MYRRICDSPWPTPHEPSPTLQPGSDRGLLTEAVGQGWPPLLLGFATVQRKSRAAGRHRVSVFHIQRAIRADDDIDVIVADVIARLRRSMGGPSLSSLTKIIAGAPSKQPAGPNAHPLVVRH